MLPNALDLASRYPSEISGLVIESGFAFTIPLLDFLGADTRGLGITEADGLGHTDKISQFSGPTLIIHAEFDQFIPVSDAQALLQHCPAQNKALEVIPGADHNTIFMVAGERYFETIRAFFQDA